jgi:TonB family protein
MAASPAKSEMFAHSARRYIRLPLSLPVNVISTRSTLAELIPGRALNVSEGGLRTAIAGELGPFELVSLEFRLPDVGIPVRTKAWVRHQSGLCCGLEFTGLSLQQRSMIRYWLQRSSGQAEAQQIENAASVPKAPKAGKADVRPFRRMLLVLGSMIIALSCILAGWYWQQGWEKIESGLPTVQADIPTPVTVSAAEVEKLIIHQVTPIYPEAAQPSNLSGVVKLNVVIEQDGTVSAVTVLSGPKVFQSAAVNAIKWWRFQPYVINGQAARVQTVLAIEFRQ